MKSQHCLVIDVWEGQLDIDEAILKNNSIAGIGIRLNDMNGGHHKDAGFDKQWKESINFVRFPYFVYNPWVNGKTNYDWLVANMPVGAKSVAIDIEVFYEFLTPQNYAAEVNKFLTLCNFLWKTIIYTGQGYTSLLAKWPYVDYWWAQYPAPGNYFNGINTWDGFRANLSRLELPFNATAIPGKLKMWQVTGDYLTLPGSTRKIDINIFYGTETELANYFGSVVDPVIVPTPEITVTPPEVPVTVPPEVNGLQIKSVMIDGVKIPAVVAVNYTHDGVELVVSLDQSVKFPPPPKPPVVTQTFPALYRVKDDIEAGVPQRPFIRNGLPSTVRINGGKRTVRLSPEWLAYVYAIQLEHSNYQFITPTKMKPDVGWHNGGDPMLVEQLTFSGNVVEVTKIIGRQCYISSLFNSHNPPPDLILPMPNKLNPYIQLFTTQFDHGLDISTNERYPRTLIIANPGEELWIDIGDLVRV